MPPPAEAAQFDQIVQYVQQTRGFDFTAYKRTTLMRRVLRRMQAVGAGTFEEYFDYLQVHQNEFGELFNTILINVTSFFRDAEVWTRLRRDILPELVNGSAGRSFRVWSAACASGQEPYTLAMVLAELLGPDAFRDRVKIYATDIDEEALATARAGAYPARQLEDVPAELAAKYFDRHRETVTLKRELRRVVIFGRHDLHQDAPISRVDLLLCRNTLMYFNADAQSRILAKFYFSLVPNGHVVLGKAEMLLTHGAMFAPVDLKHRIFRAIPKPHHRDRLLLLAQTGQDVMAPQSNQSKLREMAFESDAIPQIVVDAGGMLVAVSGAARQRFGIEQDDIGRPLRDLEVSSRPAELRSALNVFVAERRPVQIKDVEWTRGSEVRHFDVDLAPLHDEDGNPLGARVTFHEVTELKRLRAELQHSKQELETAYEELQSTNEELETTNEELQSTIEELETTNEELQSTNEELETMNEELQSTNEELQTMNDELRTRSTDLNSTNSFLEAVFASLRSAVVVLDREFNIQVWNPHAMSLWGLRPEEVYGKPFFGLDIGLPVSSLHQPIRDVLSGEKACEDVVLPATSRTGKPIECHVRLTALRPSDGSLAGAILIMEERQV